MSLHASKILFAALLISLMLSTLLRNVALAETQDNAAATIQSTSESREPFSDEEIRNAINSLEEDPNLAGKQKIHTLHWVKKDQQAKPKKDADKKSRFDLAWLKTIGEWLGNFFGWITEAGRFLVWTVAFILAAVLAVWLLRYLQQRQSGSKKLTSIIPTHVRDLDIRPESLPDDVGAAARTLWSQQAHREALSLLYRGCVSRLVHVHGIAIKQSSTEGECAQLARNKLEAHRHVYVTTLIRVWQQAVYGGVDPNDDVFEQLCAGFATALDGPAPTSDAFVGARA